MICLVGLMSIGCGVKGPPVPPRQPPFPAVVDLSYRVAGPAVTLGWSIPQALSGEQAGRSFFAVYRSRSALDQPACEGCPLVFDKVATMPYADSQGNRFAKVLPLDPGFRYVFKVRLETGQNFGPDSNLVRFDHLAEALPGSSEKP